jgi:CubicO group peptidase (beta-lactamase class C family)
MSGMEASVDRIAAETRFSGVVRVERSGDVQLAKAYGLSHRGLGVANAVDTQFGIASGTKGLTALTVVSLIEEGRLKMTTTARSVGEDLKLIDDEVTAEHLLAHRSGIGDYFDERSTVPSPTTSGPRPSTSSKRPNNTSGCSTDTRASSHRTNGSPTATAATSCSL